MITMMVYYKNIVTLAAIFKRIVWWLEYVQPQEVRDRSCGFLAGLARHGLLRAGQWVTLDRYKEGDNDDRRYGEPV
ncbi:MAG: hypothetical protein IDH49_00270 [Gammaproteobacteria bacterium]|nr:hypothetical protein [Gammaproteobacteria bacterium]